MKRTLVKIIILTSSMMFLFSCTQTSSSPLEPQSSDPISIESSAPLSSSEQHLTMKSDVYGHYWVDDNNNRIKDEAHDLDIVGEKPTRDNQNTTETWTCKICGYTFDRKLSFEGVELSSTTPLKSIQDEFDNGLYDFVVDWIPRVNDEDWGDFYKTRNQSERLILRQHTASLRVDFMAPVEGFNTSVSFSMWEEDNKTYVVRSQKHTYYKDTKTWEFHNDKVVDYYYYIASIKEVALAYTRYDEINSNIFDVVNGELALKNTETEYGNRTRTNLTFSNDTQLNFMLTTDKNEKAMVNLSHLGVEKEIVYGDYYLSYKIHSPLRELPSTGNAYELF